MSVHASKARLTGLAKQLTVAWEQTHTTWTDDKAREFHQRYLMPLIAELEKSVSAMDNLDKLIQKVKDDCE